MTALSTLGCSGCRDGAALDFDFSMAFQPLVDMRTGEPFAYEALIRGRNGETPAELLGRVTPATKYAFDQQCRVKAIETAVAAGILATRARLSINFLPNAVYSPRACIQLTLKTAAATGLPLDRLIFEFTENERMTDPGHVANIVRTYQDMGFGTALDDFGAGHAGLGLLAQFQPDVIKLDMELIRGVDASLPRRMIVEGLVRMCREMGLILIGEGVETEAELETLLGLGIRYIQGFVIARPEFETLPRYAPPSGIGAVRAAG